jgi:HTH-type transcriptional regulator/antitoxin HigA
MAADGSPEADEREVLVTLIEAYEKKHYPIQIADPIEAIKFRMDYP